MEVSPLLNKMVSSTSSGSPGGNELPKWTDVEFK